MKRSVLGSRELLATVSLWGATAVFKLVNFGFGLKLGRIGGAAALGTYGAVGNVAWLVACIAGAGWPGWATFHAARLRAQDTPLDDAAGAGHGRFLVQVGLAYLLLVPLSPALADSRALESFALLIMAAGLLQSVSAFTLGLWRGVGRPGLEVVTLVIASAAMGVLLWLAEDVHGLALAAFAASAAHAVVAVGGMLLLPGARPRFRPAELARVRSGEALSVLVLGLCNFALINLDMLALMLWSDASTLGYVQAATVFLRASTVAPWLMGTVLLHRFRRRQLEGEPTPLAPLLAASAFLSVAVGLLTWGAQARGLLPGWYRMEAQQLAPLVSATVVSGPALLTALMLTPIAAATDMQATNKWVALGLAVGLLAAGLGLMRMGAAGALLGAGLGQLVIAGGLLVVLRRPASVVVPVPGV